jgi:hypothetical protein
MPRYGLLRFARNDGTGCFHVIACDKREAFAQGSVSDEAIQPFSRYRLRRRFDLDQSAHRFIRF